MVWASKPLEKSRGFSFLQNFCGAGLDTTFHLCYKPFLSRGQKTSKLFQKKVELTFDKIVDVIDVTRITSVATTDFVSAYACNPSFGQGYAHFLIGEIEMETDKIIEMFGLTLRTFGSKKGVKDLKPIRLMVNDDAMWTLKRASFEAHCSVSELCHAIVMQWLSEHEAEIEKD